MRWHGGDAGPGRPLSWSRRWSRRRPAGAALAAAVACVAGGIALAWPGSPPRPPAGYYLSLGDSLSQGFQPRPGRPGPGRDTDQGYADVVARFLGARIGRVALVKLGCPGETTTTFVAGGICRRAGGSQEEAGLRFLRAHRGQVALVTIDLGINDVVRCEPAPASYSCVGRGLARVEANLGQVLAAVRAAAPGVAVVGLDYYAPFVQPEAGADAGWSTAVTQRLNAVLADLYAHYHMPVADVAGAFRTGQLTVAATAGRPAETAATAAVCRLTWMCAPPPTGPNLHANGAGYRAMAGAVESVLDQLPALRRRAALAHPAAGLQHHQVGQGLP